MSPSGVQKERMVPDDIYVMTAAGEVIHEGVNPEGVKLKLRHARSIQMHAWHP